MQCKRCATLEAELEFPEPSTPHVDFLSREGFRRKIRRETDFLLVQLRRYAQRGGRVFKTGSPISILPGESVWVPCWDEGTDLRYVEYQARALIFHLGANLLTGHYRAALSFGARTGLLHWYLTDDGIHPAMATSDDLQMLAKNVCIVGLVRAEL